MANCDNPHIGKNFQILACKVFSQYFQQELKMEEAIEIGYPPKAHHFDCASEDHSIVIECKCYTWTETGNIPSAKLMGLNEAVFYLNYLPFNTEKIIAMKKDTYAGKTETLAEYYNRIDGHLLNHVQIAEIDDEGKIRRIRRKFG